MPIRAPWTWMAEIPSGEMPGSASGEGSARKHAHVTLPRQVAPPLSVLVSKAADQIARWATPAARSRMSSFAAHPILIDDDSQRVLELSQWSVEDREGILFIELYVGRPDELTTDTLTVVA